MKLWAECFCGEARLGPEFHMIKSVFGLLVVGVALIPFTNGQRHGAHLTNDAALPAIAQKADFVGFTVNSASGQSCTIKMLGSPSDATIKLQVEPTCEQVSAGLSQAATWINGDKGTASLMGSDGQTILSVGPSDGFAYEAIGSDIVTFSES
jgi:hypothetical protein